MSAWFHTGLSGFYGLPLYERPGFSYPPVWGYLLQILGWLIHQAGLGPAFFGVQNPDLSLAALTTGDFSDIVTSPAYNLLLKSILFGFDLGTGLIIFRFVTLLTGDLRRARIAFAIWFLNPFVIYQSAVHAAADGLVGFFVLAAVVLVLSGRPFWGGAAWVMGILTKVTPVILGMQFLITLLAGTRGGSGSTQTRMKQLGLFAIGSTLTAVSLLIPETLFGSVPMMLQGTLARSQGGVVVGGLSLMGIRHLKPWSWLLVWAYNNSAVVVRASEIAEVAAIVGWSGWTLFLARRNPAFALLTGTVGSLASLMLLSPSSQPQYVLWWLPVLVVIVVVTERGYWQLGILIVAPLVFSLAILGPEAVLAPLATYTKLLSARVVGEDAIRWYVAPGRLWGNSLGDDFFGPAAVLTVAALIALFAVWASIGLRISSGIQPWREQTKLR